MFENLLNKIHFSYAFSHFPRNMTKKVCDIRFSSAYFKLFFVARDHVNIFFQVRWEIYKENEKKEKKLRNIDTDDKCSLFSYPSVIEGKTREGTRGRE